MIRHVIDWLSVPTNDVLLVTWLTAVMQAVASETGWRWAHIVANVLASLPGLNAKGLITAAKKP